MFRLFKIKPNTSEKQKQEPAEDQPSEFSKQCNGKSLLYETTRRKRRRDFSAALLKRSAL